SGADAIISIHINSYDVEHVNGATTMYKDSKDLAEAIQASLISATGAKDMGSVKYNNMSILNRAEMESVIVETGFLTNEAEAALLNTYDYQVKVANGITAGIDSYFKGE
ncbi:MAG: N-acetylmuramoyl-L-alanine amidase, partial [Clostridia bacterium]|nr:N-acetylmuramoyl-L-alanine amidase [Clostridia bacterium]